MFDTNEMDDTYSPTVFFFFRKNSMEKEKEFLIQFVKSEYKTKLFTFFEFTCMC